MQPLASDLWLLERNAFHQLAGFAGLSVRLDPEQAREVAKASPRREKMIAVLPIHGALEARPSLIGELLGMSSYERIGRHFDMLMAEDSVTSIILDLCTPGGSVYGCAELANKFYLARGKKRDGVIAVANPLAASGGYWLGAAADRFVVVPSGDVGSVGVIAQHIDFSQALEKEGAKATVIRSSQSPYKGEGNDVEPLSDEARTHLQARADSIHQQFAADLAKFRGVSVEYVNEHFGQGRVVSARKAMAVGMVDRIDTLDGIAQKLLEGRVRLGKEAAMDCWDAPTRRESVLEKAAAIRALA
jgi:signal peptide peptidase SppA